MSVVIEVKNLTKRYGSITAVDRVSFGVEKGEILGLLGPNGAGKTTTIHLLLGLTEPDEGTIRILGMDLRHHRKEILRRVNFSSAYTALPSNLTVWENLYIFGLLYGVKKPRRRIRELLEMFGIPEIEYQRTGTLSSGQATRLNLCKAFINSPDALFLDEPTASLDPDIARKVRQILKDVQRSLDVTMVYTSHNMQEIEIMCDRVIFLAHGRVVKVGTPKEITQQARAVSLEEVFIELAREPRPKSTEV